MATRRIISSDSHVSVQHDDVKAHLASRFHDDYDAALAQAFREMLGGNAAKANAGGGGIRRGGRGGRVWVGTRGRRTRVVRRSGARRGGGPDTAIRTSACATWTPTAST